MGEAYDADDILPRMAQVLAAGTGAEVAVVWLRVGDELHPSATFPTGAMPPADPPEGAVEVLHQGERLGALSVAMPASDPMDPARHKLVEDLAAQAGLVLRNVRLIEELRASRQRLVAAQDEERRRLERNIHDGAQQQLVADTRRTSRPRSTSHAWRRSNVAKYADASTASVALSQTNGLLIFVVADDGRGFDPGATGYGTGLQGIADRLDAIGVTLAVDSSTGAGTTITGTVPAVSR